MAGEALLVREPQLSVGGARREDDGGCLVHGAARESDALDRSIELERLDVVVEDLGTETLGLRLHLLHELGALDALGETGKVLDVGRVHELAAHLDRAGNNERLEVGTRRIDGRCESCRTRSDDDDLTQNCSLWLLAEDGNRGPCSGTNATARVFRGWVVVRRPPPPPRPTVAAVQRVPARSLAYGSARERRGS